MYGNTLCILKSANENIHSLDTWTLGSERWQEQCDKTELTRPGFDSDLNICFLDLG